MQCPRLEDLPFPVWRRGWPWTRQSDALPGTQADGREWPKITVVTPSFNQGRFLEETIRSVLLQGYPDLEYIVIDGGSTDQSLRIIRRYERWLSGWVSEKDRGQSHAINKGFARATGEIMAWLNSDDTYEQDCLGQVARRFLANPDWKVLVGGAHFIDERGRFLKANMKTRCPSGGGGYVRLPRNTDMRTCRFDRDWFCQQACFWRREAWEKGGPLDESLHWAMDYDLWCRMAAQYPIQAVSDVLASYRLQRDAKSVARPGDSLREAIAVAGKHLDPSRYQEMVRDHAAVLEAREAEPPRAPARSRSWFARLSQGRRG